MNKVKEEMLQQLREVKQTAQLDLQDKPGYENYDVKNVKYYGKVELVNKITGEKESFDLHVIEIAEKETENLETIYYLNGQEIDFTELLRNYESPEPIKDVVDKAEENKQKPEKEQNKELEIQDLNKLEAEQEKEDKDSKKKDKEQGNDEIKKRKPSYVIERINPDKAKMDYWKTIKQAFDLPPEVDTLAFSYPVSSEDKVDYANITIYMLGKDGYILDNYKIDDYFAFDASTGNNPMQDDTIRHEKDENKGKTQIDDNNTMIRLMAKKASDPNSYISLEQKNGTIDYNDINAGKKVVGGTQNVEHQLETDRFRVRDVEVEKMVRSNTGRYNMNEMFSEAEKHKEHGDEEYIQTVDADGKENTTNCMKEKNWKELATKWGYYKDGKPDEEKARVIYTEYKDNNPHLSDEQVVQEVSDDLYEQIPGRNRNR